MKRRFISFLVMTLLVANTTMVQAATTSSTENTSTTTTDDTAAASTNKNATKISLDNIEDVMLENNLDMKSASNTLKIAEEQFKKAKEQVDEYYDSSDDDDDNYDDYVSSQNTKISTLKAAYEALVAEGADSTDAYDDWQEAVSDLSSFKSAYSSEDTYKKAYRKAKLTYAQSIKDSVYSAQQEYVSYLTAVSSREVEENTVKIKERTAQTYKLQYESGFLSKTEYDKAVLANTTENSSLSKLKDAEELAKTKLCTTLGISDEKNTVFSTDIKEDLLKVSQIKYDEDLSKMIENSYDIQVQDMTIEDLKDEIDDYDDDTEDDDDIQEYQDDIYDYQLKNAENTLENLKNTAETNFKTQYNTLMSSYNTMKNDYDNLNQVKNDYSIAQAEYDYGFASKNDVEDAKIGSDGIETANTEYENAKNTFYSNYLRYLQMKEGY